MILTDIYCRNCGAQLQSKPKCNGNAIIKCPNCGADYTSEYMVKTSKFPEPAISWEKQIIPGE